MIVRGRSSDGCRCRYGAAGEGRLDHGLGDRGGDGAALVTRCSRGWFWQQHRHRDRGVVGRGEGDEPGVDRVPVPVWAVPVLPATCTPGMLGRRPGAAGLLTTEIMSWVTWAAVAGEVACSQGFGW